jgi:hypothetical protein
MAKVAKPVKMILTLGYNNFILEAEAAMELFKMLSGGVELYDTVWNNDTRKQEPRVKPMDIDDNSLKLRMLTEETYALGKLLYATEQSQEVKP